MEEFLKFGRFKRECVKIQGEGRHGLPLPPFSDAHASMSILATTFVKLHALSASVNPVLLPLHHHKIAKVKKRVYFDLNDNKNFS